MKQISLFFIGFVLLLAGCSQDDGTNPNIPMSSAPAAVESQAELNAQILKQAPSELVEAIPENERNEVLAGRLFVYYLETPSAPPPNPSGQCAPLLTITLSATGIATYMGPLTDEQIHCLDPTTFEVTDGLATFTSIWTGEQLLIAYEANLLPTPDPTVVSIDGHTNIAGGTGRFKNATGEGIARGTINLTTGATKVLGIGKIHFNRYDNALESTN